MMQFIVREGRAYDLYFKPKIVKEVISAIEVQTLIIQEEQLQHGDTQISDHEEVGKMLLQHLHQACGGRKNAESADVVAAVEKLRAVRGARSIQTASVQCLGLDDFPPIAVDPGNIEYRDVRTLVAQSTGKIQGSPGGAFSNSNDNSGQSAPGAQPPGIADVFNKGTSAAQATGFHVPVANSPLRRVYAIQQRYYFALAQTTRSRLYVTGKDQQVLQGQLPLVLLKALEGSPSSTLIAVLGVLTFEAGAGEDKKGKATTAGGSGARGFDTGTTATTGTGVWYLEDCIMRVELVITQHTTALSCGIFAAGAIVIARGNWDGGRFIVQGFSFPPPEPRSKSLSIVNKTDCFGLAPHDAVKALAMEKASEAVVLTLAHVHLDKPDTIAMVQLLISKIASMEPSNFTFVFVGDFNSQARSLGDPSFHEEGSRTYYHEMMQLFTNLGESIRSVAPNFAAHSQFIFVPGPTDLTSCGNTLPQHPLSNGMMSGFTARCPKTTLSPNPCRLRFGTYEVVISRMDSQRLWKKPRVVRPLQTAEDGTTIFKKYDHVAKTIIEQHSVAPFLGIGNGGAGSSGSGASGAAGSREGDATDSIWAQDHTLRLFPLPHTLVVCDSSEQWKTPCGETDIINPGCFALDSTFLWMTPSRREYQINVVRD